MDVKNLKQYLANDAADKKQSSLEEHDKKFHPSGYKPGGKCKFREKVAKTDEADRVKGSADVESKGNDVFDRVSVKLMDITKFDGDAIVNAANRWMLGGGGVDGAIHRAAGPKLLDECRKHPADRNGFRCQVGEAKVTGAGNLPCKNVIHTVGPDVREYADIPRNAPLDGFGKPRVAADWDTVSEKDKKRCAKELGDCYTNSLLAAKKVGAKSVCFPSISTGVFGYPVEEASKVAASAIAGFLKENGDMSVTMALFDPDPKKAAHIKKCYEDAFGASKGKSGSDVHEKGSDEDVWRARRYLNKVNSGRNDIRRKM